MKYIFSLGFIFFVIACNTAPKQANVATAPKRILLPSSETGEPNVDYVALQRSLGLERTPESLGFAEKPFNTCTAGYGYSSTNNCRQMYFVVINYQLTCRMSDDAVANGISNEDQIPIGNRSLIWTLKGVNGNSQTDSQGFGQIATVSAISQRPQRLKLSTGVDFLYMKANELTKVVTPHSWCQ